MGIELQISTAIQLVTDALVDATGKLESESVGEAAQENLR